MRRVLLIAVGLLLACATHKKAGDRAAAVGDWKVAAAEYREAVKRKPNDPETKAKYEKAKQEAYKQSMARAGRCLEDKDFECASTEAEYSATLDDGTTEARALRTKVKNAWALDLVQKARSAGARSSAVEALDFIVRARSLATEPLVVDEVTAAQPEVVRLAVTESEGCRSRGLAAGRTGGPELRRAVQILGKVAELDASRQPLLSEAKSELEKWTVSEYDYLVQEGTDLQNSQNWRAASDKYSAAESLKTGGRAQVLDRYCRLMLKAEDAVSRKEFAIASTAYRDASGMPEDSGAVAKSRLELVEVRPYRVRLQSVLVKPVRPDGTPWVGPPNPVLNRFAFGVIGLAIGGPGGATIGKEFGDAISSIPVENRPNLYVIIDLPDGRRIATTSKKAIYAAYSADFVLDSNQLDDRTILLRVVHATDNGAVDIGSIRLTMKDLFAASKLPASQSLVGVEMFIESARDGVDGSIAGFSVLPNDSNEASTASLPTKTTKGYLLTRVEAGVAAPDFINDLGMDGVPDLRVEVEQGGRLVYRSKEIEDHWEGSWNPISVFLFVEPREPLVLRLLDVDASEHDLVIYGNLKGTDFGGDGRAEFRSPNGSYVRLRFEPRKSGP